MSQIGFRCCTKIRFRGLIFADREVLIILRGFIFTVPEYAFILFCGERRNNLKLPKLE